jgi:PKHD-type hydroxylase
MPFIYPIADMLSPEMTARLRARLAMADVPWVDGKASAGRDAGKKTNMEVDPSSKFRFDIAGMVQGELTDMRRKQALHLQYLADPVKMSPSLVSKTGVGGGYADHVDNNHMSPHTPNEMRADLSMTIFLSDPDSYEGGELVIDSDMPFAPSFKMPAGSAVLYATTSVHRVNPVTKGERLAVVMWFESRINDPHLREMNADLLECLNTLASDPNTNGGTSAATRHVMIKLEKVRANLIKGFS